jgi:type IV secretion system protein VirB10
MGLRLSSAQARAGNLLAIGLMSMLGLGALTWYYAHAILRQDRVRENARAAAAKRAEGDMPLPSLGRIDSPLTGLIEPTAPPDASLDRPTAVARTLAEIPPTDPAVAPGPPPKTPEQLALEREMSGAVFSVNGAASGGSAQGAGDSSPVASAGASAAVAAAPAGAGNDLSSLLRSGVAAAAHPHLLPTQRLWLPKGAFIDCTLETAIDSTLPGMTTCVMATDAFGVDGKVVLLERGTKLIGETRGQVQQGADRIFVLWTEARTPAGVIVPLDSPAADELGRSGLAGDVNRHFWQRFGAAMLVSVIDGAVQAAVQSSRSGGTVVLNPYASQDVLTEVLRSTISIAPTVVKKNGDRIQVLVARDVDFRSVYELRSAASR